MLRRTWESVASGGSPAGLVAVLPRYAHQACALCTVLAAFPGAFVSVFRSQNDGCVVIVSTGIGWRFPGVSVQVRSAPILTNNKLFRLHHFQNGRSSVERARFL